MKNRIKLIEHFAELGFTKGAEIGVCDGRFSEIMCQKIPGLNLLSVDSWALGSAFPNYKVARALLAPYKNVTILRGTSADAGRMVTNCSLDFVFIDAEHSYLSVTEDVAIWAKKVKVGGIVSGHDYYVTRQKNRGVIDAVDEYVKKYDYKLQLTGWDKNNPVKDDRQPSWYFTKDK